MKETGRATFRDVEIARGKAERRRKGEGEKEETKVEKDGPRQAA